MSEARGHDGAERYDVLVLVKRFSVTGPSDDSREWIHLAGHLVRAHEVLRKVREGGGLAIVVPTRYRGGRMNEADAQAIARVELERLRGEQPGRFSELSIQGDEGAFWHFTVEDSAAQAQERIPGTRSILVDKLDGRLWSPEEATTFWRLSVQSS